MLKREKLCLNNKKSSVKSMRFYTRLPMLEELAVEEWRRQFETNFFGLVAVTKAVLPAMRERRNGKIVNISSISGRIGFPSMGPYVASKFAVEGFSESLRLEMLPDTAPAPDEVIQQIVQVAKSPSPKLRYPVGKGVKLGIVISNKNTP
jgi:NAD(P)-dependent dehydrogenase (short-subunit alcohol dehydrogenase family)